MKLIKVDTFHGRDEEEITGLPTTRGDYLQSIAELLNKIEGDLSGVHYSVVDDDYQLQKGSE